jgi:transposase-like protein
VPEELKESAGEVLMVKVYTEIVPDVKAATLQGVMRGRVDIDSVIHSDGWRGYDGLVDIGYNKHFADTSRQERVC